MALAAGLLMALAPLLLSGFRSVPGGLGDTRLVHFSLEHAHRHLLRQEPHRSFWDPPLFYPARNVAAYTDTMLSFVPFYSPWRVLGFAPDTAFQLWLVTVWSLNFVAFYVFLTRILSLSPPAAAAGSFLFAFGSSRLATFYVSTVGKRHDLSVHEDAMWAATATGVATINGRYGNTPPRWNLMRRHRRPGDERRREASSEAIGRWVTYHCLDPAKVCWIELETPLGARSPARTARWLAPAVRRCSGS